ncbi:MAG: FkbM family methyltransferase, partial [Candidatus Thorarchaeota archaeon]
HSFEPVPMYFKKLNEMSQNNKNYNIYVNNFALGKKSGKIQININKDLIGANTIVSGLLNSNIIKETIDVNIKRLDEYISEKKIKNISLIKIDVEGYELPLLKGCTRFFENNKNLLPPMIVEITPAAYSLLGSKLEDLDNLLSKFNYKAYSTDEKYRIDIKNLEQLTDVLFKQE